MVVAVVVVVVVVLVVVVVVVAVVVVAVVRWGSGVVADQSGMVVLWYCGTVV